MKNNMERQFYSINLVVELDASDNITMKDIKGLTLDDTYAVDIKAIDPEDENLQWKSQVSAESSLVYSKVLIRTMMVYSAEGK
jgi:hypothetical protein